MKRKYSLLIALMLYGNCWAQVSIPNKGFEQGNNTATTQTAYWKPEADNFFCKTDNKESYKGSYSLKLHSTTEGNHFFYQEFAFASKGLRKYTLKCAVKTKNLEGKVQLGVRLFDSQGRLLPKTVCLLTENVNQEWTIAEGFFVADKEAATIRLFGNLFGTGEAWFDEISIEDIPKPTKAPSTEVAMYVHEYFDIVYENSVISDKNVIANLKSKTMYLCADSISMEHCHAILTNYTTPNLQDNHSFFTTASVWKEMMGGGKHPNTGIKHQEMPRGKMVAEKIGYIHIPMFISSDTMLMQQYADSLQNIIATIDTQNPNGYIIDLSKNGGGNSLPMVAGIGPLIGNGVCGYSFSGDGSIQKRIYDNGKVCWDTSCTFQKTNPYHLQFADKPIAIIYSNETGSSGEVVAIAFMGLPKTKSFGQTTAGITTTVSNYEMSDGAYLNMVSGYSADRNKNKFDGAIKPDKETNNTEEAIAAAITWILK